MLCTIALLLVSSNAMGGEPPTVRLMCPPVANLKFTAVQSYTVSGVTVANRPFGQLGNRPLVRASILPIVAPIAVVRSMSSTGVGRFGEPTHTVVMPTVRYGITSGSGGCSNGSCGTVSRFYR